MLPLKSVPKGLFKFSFPKSLRQTFTSVKNVSSSFSNQPLACTHVLTPSVKFSFLQTMACYWPEEGAPAEFGPLVVKLVETRDYGGVTGRTFTLKNLKKRVNPKTLTTFYVWLKCYLLSFISLLALHTQCCQRSCDKNLHRRSTVGFEPPTSCSLSQTSYLTRQLTLPVFSVKRPHI